MSNPRLAMIGCGQIAEFHAPAFRAAGFDLAAVSSKPGSTRLKPFAEKHDIPLLFDEPSKLFEARSEWDAVLIVAPIEATIENLQLALHSAAPVLVEKPVSLRAADLEPLIHRELPVMVGYNRRFYRTVREARNEVATGGPVLAHMAIPDSVPTPTHPDDDPAYLSRFFSNSVHGLDMLRFIFSDLHVEHVQRVLNPNGAIMGLVAILSADDGSVVQLTANWRAPANFTLTLDRPGHRMELWPFEAGNVYEGMEVVEPTQETPIRSFRPKLVSKVNLDEWDYTFKPGFLDQAKAFLALVRGEDSGPAATLDDAYAVLGLAEQLAGQACGQSVQSV